MLQDNKTSLPRTISSHAANGGEKTLHFVLQVRIVNFWGPPLTTPKLTRKTKTKAMMTASKGGICYNYTNTMHPILRSAG
jgi:hypothetical protein